LKFPPPQRPGRSSPSRVVVTGTGVITALGCGWDSNAEGFRAGGTAFRPVTLFDVSRQRAKTAAEVDLPAGLPPARLPAKVARRLGRAARMLLWAAHQAWSQAGWQAHDNLPVVLGSTGGEMSYGEDYFRHAVSKPRSQRGQPTRVVRYQLQRQGLDLCDALDFHGPVTVISNACASGSNAIGHAFQLVRAGGAEKVFAGGYDALCHLTFAGFDSLQALSPTSCRPFDAARDGLLLGEGAATLALEAFDRARARSGHPRRNHRIRRGHGHPSSDPAAPRGRGGAGRDDGRLRAGPCHAGAGGLH